MRYYHTVRANIPVVSHSTESKTFILTDTTLQRTTLFSSLEREVLNKKSEQADSSMYCVSSYTLCGPALGCAMLPYLQVGANLYVAEATVWRIVDRFQRTGDVCASLSTPRERHLTEHDEFLLIEFVCENPS